MRTYLALGGGAFYLEASSQALAPLSYNLLHFSQISHALFDIHGDRERSLWRFKRKTVE